MTSQDLHPSPATRRRERILWILIPLAGFAWFWFWRASQWTGGDAEQWEREIHYGVWWRKRQMLAFASMQLIHHITRAAAGWSSRLAINLYSCLAGALGLLASWRMHAGRGARPGEEAAAFLVIATAGFTTVFYGHIETYAGSVAALLLHLLAIQRSTEERWPAWTIAATFSLVVFFHLAILFALPAMLIIQAVELRRRRLGAQGWVECAFAISPAAALWIAVRYLGLGHGELVIPFNWVHPPAEMLLRPWLVFTGQDWAVKGTFVLWNAGAAAPLALWVFGRYGREDRFTLYLLAIFICLIVFTLVWAPFAELADFDLFCYPWVVAVVAVSRWVMRLRLRALLLGLILGVNFYLWLARPAQFARIGRRGHGTIVWEEAGRDPEVLVLLDDWLRLEKVNRYVPEGAHKLALRRPGRKHVERIVIVHPGERYVARFD